MKAVPMIFNTEMVQALLDGRKTVTRRPLSIPDGWSLRDSKLTKITSSHPKKGKWGAIIRQETFDRKFMHDLVPAPCFVGDLIYVRETWGVVNHALDDNGNMIDWTPDRPSLPVKEMKFGSGYYTGHAIYRSDGEMRWCNDFEDEVSAWHPSIHMPRSISRITLKVTDVRIERVQDINPKGARSEGFNDWTGFAYAWSSIYLKQGLGWDNNPYVWVIEFEVIHKNVDEVLREMEVDS